MQTLQALLRLPTSEQDALGITATAKEIMQQPATWETTRRIFEDHASSLRSYLEAAGVTEAAERRPTVIFTGAGTSDYIGQALALLLQTVWQCESRAIPSTDLLTNMQDCFVPGKRYLLISFSRSGDSPEGVSVLEQALERYPGMSHLVITCNAHARMIELTRNRSNVHTVVLDDAVNDRSLAMTSSFTNMVIFGQCLAHLWSTDTYTGIFEQLVRGGATYLVAADEAARALASARPQRVCFLGSGALTSIARESALKVLEMTAGEIKTMSESVLGLRHGPMAALDSNTMLVCFASSDARRQRYEVDLLQELAAKGVVSQRVVVGPAGNEMLQAASEMYLSVPPGIPDLYRPPLDVALGQLLGFHASLENGLRPDAPSPGGVISRVVGQFQIYKGTDSEKDTALSQS